MCMPILKLLKLLLTLPSTFDSNTYVSHWEKSSKMVSVEDPSLIGGGNILKQHIWNAARDTIQEVRMLLFSCTVF